MAEEMSDLRGAMGLVAGMAGVATAVGEPARAARILGAVDAAREESGIRRMAHAPHAARIESEVRAKVAEPEFDAAWREGSRISFAAAVAEAIALAAMVREPAAPVARREASLGLSPRELDVVRLLAQGFSDKEIAAALYIGVRTVQTHVANVFAKLGVNGRAEAAAIAVRRGLALAFVGTPRSAAITEPTLPARSTQIRNRPPQFTGCACAHARAAWARARNGRAADHPSDIARERRTACTRDCVWPNARPPAATSGARQRWRVVNGSLPASWPRRSEPACLWARSTAPAAVCWSVPMTISGPRARPRGSVVAVSGLASQPPNLVQVQRFTSGRVSSPWSR